MSAVHFNIEDMAKVMSEEEIAAFLSEMSPQEILSLKYQWPFWARRGQLPPEGKWTYWMLLAGRGYGKTRVGAEWVRSIAEAGTVEYIHLIAPTNGDIRKVMLEGESGLLNISPSWFMPKYEPSKSRVVWPNGVKAYLFSAEEPDRLRGPQCGAFWADELAAWEHLDETWSNIQFGFRLGRSPQGVITTTPRPLALVKKLNSNPNCKVTKGSTYDNRANLAEPFFEEVITAYEGTRLGRQELNGEILEDNPNSLFQQRWFDKSRLEQAPADLEKIIVAVDPNVKENIDSDECGIVIVGMKTIDGVKHYYVLSDATIQPETMDEWGREVVKQYFMWQADRVIAETNNGGALVIKNITSVNADIPCEEVTATRGKTKRAEPIATLCEQGRVHFCGKFMLLETQCIEWDPTLDAKKGAQKSPDRMDAFVWGVAHLSGMKGKGMVQGRAMGN